ncbi:hypothetical protein AgCh_012929 [Apium graveolens]
MEKVVHLRFHHQGEFQGTHYIHGEETNIWVVDTEKFSYTVLMEHVKDDLEYSEIGGIYVGPEGDWKLLTSDVELNRLADQTHSGDHIDFYIDNVIDMTVKPMPKMQPHVVMRPRPNLFTCKKKTNKKKLLMGRGPTTRSQANPAKPATQDASEKEDTCRSVPVTSPAPIVDLPEADDGKGSMATFWAMRKRQKEQTEKGKAQQEIDEKEKVVLSASKNIVEENIIPDIDFEEGAEEVGEEGDEEGDEQGNTRMDRVHMRSLEQRIVIGMNDDYQLIAESDKILSELSSFIGTLAKRCVSLTYVIWRHVPIQLRQTSWNYVKARYIIPDDLENWVIETIHSCWKTYKSRIKAGHFTPYENDELRLVNRPDDISLETFKMLLGYWNDESVQKRAKTNATSHKANVETHTLGPKSFAQHRNKMKNKAVVEPDIEPCDAEENINKKLSSRDAAWDELGTRHNLNWLKGRCIRPNMQNNVQTGTYIKELTAKIKEGLSSKLKDKVKKVESEFQEKVKKVGEGVELKVQQNMAVLLKRLAKVNPDIRIDIQDLCVIAASDNDDGTPITGRSSF